MKSVNTYYNAPFAPPAIPGVRYRSLDFQKEILHSAHCRAYWRYKLSLMGKRSFAKPQPQSLSHNELMKQAYDRGGVPALMNFLNEQKD